MPSPSPPRRAKWTILEALTWTTSYFESRCVESPRASAEMLLAHTLDSRRIDLYLRHDQPLGGDELAGYKSLIKRRIRHEPVAYITGQKEFWSLPLTVTPDVLIPRPDTEKLVEAAAAVIGSAGAAKALRVLELGTGSGAVTLALASQYSGHRYLATDISLAALLVAAGNAVRLGLDQQVDWVVADWLAGFRRGGPLFDVIVSNPPYVSRDMLATLSPDIRRHEPRLALDGGKDGLGCLRQIIREAPSILDPQGALFVEIGHDQREAVTALAAQTRHYRQISVIQDYGGNDRVLALRIEP